MMIEQNGQYMRVKCDLCKILICRFNDWAIGDGSLEEGHIFCNKCFERLMK